MIAHLFAPAISAVKCETLVLMEGMACGLV